MTRTSHLLHLVTFSKFYGSFSSTFPPHHSCKTNDAPLSITKIPQRAAFSPFLGGIHFRPSPLSIRTFLYRTPSHYFINGSFSPLANSSLTSPLSIRTFLYRTSPSHYFINGSFSSLANSSTALLPLRQFTELINRSPHFFPGLSILPTKLSLYL
jgi:hypothetical protein